MKNAEQQMKDVAEIVALNGEVGHIFKLVVAEWQSDPMSVQCFDLRIVKRAKEIVKRMREINPNW